jgi:hypothetical protein
MVRSDLKRFPARLAPAIAVVLALLLSPALAQAQTKPRAERPTYTLGEKWVRNDGLYELIRIEKDVYVMKGEMEGALPLVKVSR